MTKATILENTKYIQGIARANRMGIKVLRETRDDSGKLTGWDTNSATGATHHHVALDGRDLICNCQAAQHGMYCMHRAAVTRMLITAN